MMHLTEKIDFPEKDVDYLKAAIYEINHIGNVDYKADVFLNHEEYSRLFGEDYEDKYMFNRVRTLCAYDDLSRPFIVKSAVKMLRTGTKSFQDIQKFIFYSHMMAEMSSKALNQLRVKMSIMEKFKGTAEDVLGDIMYNGQPLEYHGKIFSNNVYRHFFSDDDQVYAYADPANNAEKKLSLTAGQTYDNISFDFTGSNTKLWMNYNYPRIIASNIRKLKRKCHGG